MTTIPVLTLSTFLSQPPKSLPHFLIFFASPTASLPSWCPDCIVALPYIRAEIPVSQSSMIYVGNRSEWKDEKSEFRTKWGLKSVPTIVRISAGIEGDKLEAAVKTGVRLVDAGIANVERLRSFVRGE